ncbi:MAG: ATP-grasp domain-containing protein, partial [Acidobacteria bacterium]|nr:ATP-grasp domain-containing protein [Acidobacteriota bacterium]
SAGKQRILLLCTTTGYQTQSMVDAAQKLGLEVVFATDRCHVLPDPWQDGAIAVRFESPEAGAAKIVDYARQRPLAGVVCVGDSPTPTAARVAQALALPGHPPEAADICRDKYLSRERLREGGLRVPAFRRWSTDDDPRAIAPQVRFPCVLKPLALSASRGVIRANNCEEFVAAFERIRALLKSPDVAVLREDTSNFVQVEDYIDGVEVAVEGLMDHGRLRILAIFDKPDPLTGPFFEETIYVTPSRLPEATQKEIANTLAAAVRALRLYDGPLHAELRISGSQGRDEVWVMEVAARPIGGLCSKTLRFRIPLVDEQVSLEDVLIRLALGADVSRVQPDLSASGVMMIPIPGTGFLEEVRNVELAIAQSGIFDINITAKPGQKLVPLPEGSSYLGFIFARASTPQQVEDALRAAHTKLDFVIAPALPILGAPTR